MRITIISSSYKPNIGGVEEALYNLVKEYRRLGHSVNIITSKWPKDLKKREVIDGIEVERIDFVMPNLSIKGMINFIFKFPKSFYKFRKNIVSKRPDILHIQCAGPNGFYALLFRYLYRVPLIVTVHGADVQQIPYESRVMKWTLKMLFKKANFVTACSKSLISNDVKNFISTDGKRITAISNGINLEEFNVKEKYLHNRPYIFSIGRFVYKKGFDILIKAFSRVLYKFKNLDLIIAGNGPEIENYIRLVKKLGIENRVHLIGYADRKKTIKLFNGCEFFILPSRIEPQGIVNLEAMAASKAIIATSVGGVPEIVINGFNGLLISPEEPDELAGKIDYLLKNKEIRQKLGENGRKLVEENFAWLKIAKQYLKLYEKIINAKKN